MDYEKIYETFNSRMQSLLRISGKTQKDVAIALGIAESTLSRYMTTGRLPDTKYIIHIAVFFGVSMDWLLGLSDERRGALSPKEKEIAAKYAVASKDDRMVIDAVLAKYANEET